MVEAEVDDLVLDLDNYRIPTDPEDESAGCPYWTYGGCPACAAKKSPCWPASLPTITHVWNAVATADHHCRSSSLRPAPWRLDDDTKGYLLDLTRVKPRRDSARASRLFHPVPKILSRCSRFPPWSRALPRRPCRRPAATPRAAPKLAAEEPDKMTGQSVGWFVVARATLPTIGMATSAGRNRSDVGCGPFVVSGRC